MIECDLLYHDVAKRFAVWLKYPDENGFFGVDPAAAALGGVLGKDYGRRVVPCYEDLVEKIRIVDAGLDDFDIEIIKLIICIREQIDITEPFVFVGLKTSLFGGISAVFSHAEGGRSAIKTYSLKKLQETIAEIRPRITQLPGEATMWPYVNRHFVLSRLSDAGLMRRVQ